MNRVMRIAALVGSLACALALSTMSACSTSSTSSSSSVGTSCAASADCSGGTVCGYANTGGATPCTARGVCVVPVDPQPTNLCGCGGVSVAMVVNDVDAGVYYWSGVIVGEKGFPPCGDAAIAPSSDE